MSKHKRSCDDHPKFRAGCAGCNMQNRRYVIRREMSGNRLSEPAELVACWLRELRAAGYPLERLATEIGIDRAQVQKICRGAVRWVRLDTYHKIEAGYRRLRDYPGGDVRAANWAAKRGWRPPEPLPTPPRIDENLIDEIAVERAIAGEKVPLTRAEAAEAWDRLERMGLSAKQIAARLHTTAKTVHRWRAGAVRPSSSLARKQRSA